jgi:hypothetical protein
MATEDGPVRAVMLSAKGGVAGDVILESKVSR